MPYLDNYTFCNQILYPKMVATTFDIFIILTTILINILVLCISAHTLFCQYRQTITTPTITESDAVHCSTGFTLKEKGEIKQMILIGNI